MSTSSNQSRKDIRKDIEKGVRQARLERTKKNANRAGGSLLAAAVLFGSVASPAMAADNLPSLNDFTAAQWEQIDQANDATVRGTVKVGPDAEGQKILADAGVSADWDAISQKHNEKLANGNPSEDPHYNNILMDFEMDQSIIQAKGEAQGIEGEVIGDVAMVRADQKAFIPNIATDENWNAPTNLKEGDLISSGEMARNAEGSLIGPTALPIVSVTDKSTDGEHGVTTIVDPYSDGDKALRQSHIEAAGARAMPEKIDNCLEESCGYWLIITAHDEGNTKPGVAISKAVRIHVHTTASAGKTPDGSETVFDSGNGFRVVPAATASPTVGYFADSALQNWKLAEAHTEWLIHASDRGVEVSDLTVTGSGADTVLNVSTLSNFSTVDASFEAREDGGTLTLSVASTMNTYAKASEFRSHGKAWAVGDELQFSETSVDGEAVSLAATVTSVTDQDAILELTPSTDAVAFPSNHSENMERYADRPDWGITPGGGSEGGVGDIGDGTGGNAHGTAAWIPTPGGYQVEFIIGEPEPVLPEPEALPDTGTAKKGQTVRMDVIANDTISEGFELKDDSLRLIDAPMEEKVDYEAAYPDALIELPVAEQGAYRIADSENIEFVPLPDFDKKANGYHYAFVETNGEIERVVGSTVQATILPEEEPTTPPVVDEPTPEPPVVDEPTPEPPVVDEPTPEPPAADEPEPTDPPITNTMTTPPDVAVERTMNAGATEEQSALMRAWTAIGGASLVAALAGGLFFLRNRHKLQPVEVKAGE
ncbi:hypothetical protein [Citricoccus nitrophenolicus]|uniref:hypothetical protein n=1 Tax=Citricoccus nitrophenolicus TaxID=863575 RepID=UPI0031EDE567